MERGFTLVELLATLALATALATIASPSLAGLLERHRTTVALHEATGALALARMEAVRRRVPVSLCPTDDGLRCRDDLQWEVGWMLFLDPSRAGRPRGPADVLRRFDRLPHHRMRSTSGRPLVRFSPDGWAMGSNVTLTLCSRSGLAARVIVNNGGRARTERSARQVPCPIAPAS